MRVALQSINTTRLRIRWKFLVAFFDEPNPDKECLQIKEDECAREMRSTICTLNGRSRVRDHYKSKAVKLYFKK